MNKAGKIALGCLLAPVGVLALLVFFFAAMRMAGIPDPNPRSSTLHQDLPQSSTELVRDPSHTQGDAGATQLANVVAVKLEMEEGLFEIVPGPAEDGIRVDADYDDGSYELTQDYGEEDGRPSYHLAFRSRVSFWRRIADDGSWTDEDMQDNQITVQLPVGTPMTLHLELSKAEVQVDLTGLALVNLATELRMGEYVVECEDYNPVPMGEARLKSTMGEFRINGLAYLNASTIRMEASMGELTLDFRDDLRCDTAIIARLRMGQLNLRLPESARWDTESRLRKTWGEIVGNLENPAPPSEGAYLLSIDSQVFMGEMDIDTYASRPKDLLQQDRE